MGSCVCCPQRKSSQVIQANPVSAQSAQKAYPEVTLPPEFLHHVVDDPLQPLQSVDVSNVMRIDIHECTPLFSVAKLESLIESTEEVKIEPQPKRSKNLLTLIQKSDPAEVVSPEPKPVQEEPSAENAFIRSQKKYQTTKEMAEHPQIRPLKGRNTTLLLTIPMRVSSKKRSTKGKEFEDSPFSESSENISEGSSPSVRSKSPLSSSSIAFPQLSSNDGSSAGTAGLKPFESYKSIATHVRRTSVLEKKKLDEGKVTQLNQYKMSQLLGCGAFGKVYKAVDDEGNDYAIKVYNKRAMRSRWVGKGKTALSLINSEIQIMECANHQNLLILYEVINREEYHKIYLILEYAGNGTLQTRDKMTEQQAKVYFKQLMSAVEYLHEALQVVHRDIKPQNILFDSQDTLKLCDFGSAQFVQYGKDELNSSAGTYAFMAPELHGGTKTFKGKPTDIWASGITLYFMIEGKTPFKSRKMMELVEEVKNDEIVLPNNFSPLLTDLMGKMLERDPEKRITASEILSHEWLSNDNT
jgi:serine/threonine-protein kinase RIO1